MWHIRQAIFPKKRQQKTSNRPLKASERTIKRSCQVLFPEWFLSDDQHLPFRCIGLISETTPSPGQWPGFRKIITVGESWDQETPQKKTQDTKRSPPPWNSVISSNHHSYHLILLGITENICIYIYMDMGPSSATGVSHFSPPFDWNIALRLTAQFIK